MSLRARLVDLIQAEFIDGDEAEQGRTLYNRWRLCRAMQDGAAEPFWEETDAATRDLAAQLTAAVAAAIRDAILADMRVHPTPEEAAVAVGAATAALREAGERLTDGLADQAATIRRLAGAARPPERETGDWGRKHDPY